MKCGVSPSKVNLHIAFSACSHAVTIRQLYKHASTTLFLIASMILQAPDTMAQSEDAPALAATHPLLSMVSESYSAAAAIALLIQTSLIIWLLYTSARNRQLESGGKKNTALASTEQRRVDKGVSKVPC